MSEPGIGVRTGLDTDVDRTDRETMDRLASGDLGALERLYEQYGAMSVSIAYRITGDRAIAEDVVQEAFLGAWRNAARYAASRGSVRTWLLSIVHHRAIDAVRRRRPTSELPETDAGMPTALVMPDSWTEVSAALDRETVRAALDTLSIVQREAIELAYFGGLTQAEIAERTGVPLGTVKGRMRLGLDALRADVRELAAGFVLGALEPAEADALRTHVAACPEPHPELAELGSVVPALLASAEPIEPSPGLKGRILTAAAGMPQVPDAQAAAGTQRATD